MARLFFGIIILVLTIAFGIIFGVWFAGESSEFADWFDRWMVIGGGVFVLSCGIVVSGLLFDSHNNWKRNNS